MIRMIRKNANHANHVIRMIRKNANHMIRNIRKNANHANHMIRKIRENANHCESYDSHDSHMCESCESHVIRKNANIFIRSEFRFAANHMIRRTLEQTIESSCDTLLSTSLR